MLKNLAGLEVIIEGRSIKLICDNDCPLPYLKEANFQFNKYFGNLEDSAKASQEKAIAEKIEVKEEPKPD